jgi:hypothetical protein
MSNKPKDKEGLIELLKDSIKQVAEVLKIQPCELRRDEYVRGCIVNNIIHLNKSEIHSIGGFRYIREKFFPVQENFSNITEEEQLIKYCINYLYEHKILPTFTTLEKTYNLKENVFKKYFKDIFKLFEECKKVDSNCINLVFNENFFTNNYLEEVKQEIKKHKRFIITTAVSNKKVNIEFYKSLKNYASKNNAIVLVLPCEDVVSRRSACEWNFDPLLKDFKVVFSDLYLNNNLYISDIRVSAKMLIPTTGLSRLSQKYGSMIIASPKQFLEFVPRSGNKLAAAIMSSGAITENDYSNDYYMSKRLSKLAAHDHTIGAVIVEIQDNEIFHFRQIQLTDNNSIIDLGIEYFSNGNIEKVNDIVAVFGDSHVGSHCLPLHEKLKEIIEDIDIKDIVLHDLFDGLSVNHHNIGKPLLQAMKYMNKRSSLELEGYKVKDYLEDLSSCIDGKLVVVASNHNEFLDKYLINCEFVRDPENLYFSLDLCKALLENKNPLRYMIEEKIGLSEDTSVAWLNRDEEYIVHNTVISDHGDKGINGSKGNIRQLDKCYENAVIGHSHSPSLFRGLAQVGTVSDLRLDYNVGLSSWCHSICLVYNGSKQLINIIQSPKDNKYYWRI